MGVFQKVFDNITLFFFPCEKQIREALKQVEETHQDVVSSHEKFTTSYQKLQKVCSDDSCKVSRR